MIPINVDISEVANEFLLSGDQITTLRENIVSGLTSSLYEQWLLAAGKNLRSTKAQYQRGLVIVDEGRFKGGVMLTGTLPNMVESGASAFDMKNGFSKSSKVKRTKDGEWYLTIPFRLASPGALAESEIFSGIVPTSIYELVKNKPIQTSSSGRMSTKGLKTNEIPSEFRAPTTRTEVSIGSQKMKAYKSKTSIYAGLTKTMGNKGGSGQNMVFRRVGPNSDPSSWIHTGIKARNLADKALQNMQFDLRVDAIIDDFLSSL